MTGVLARAPIWAWAKPVTLTPGERANLDALGLLVLPTSLGREQQQNVVENFLAWCANYHPHADLGYGYGRPRTRWSGPSPDRDYAAQLRALGPDFPRQAPAVQRAAVETALQQAGVERMPRRPNGQFVASDLMGYYFNGAAGEDFLYNARILRDACRTLDHSEQRPQPLGS